MEEDEDDDDGALFKVEDVESEGDQAQGGECCRSGGEDQEGFVKVQRGVDGSDRRAAHEAHSPGIFEQLRFMNHS